MKNAIKFILFLTIFSFTLSACGTQPSTEGKTIPNADYIVSFNEDGIAVLRGQIIAGSYEPPVNGKLRETIDLSIPAKVEGVKAEVVIPFILSYETEISSSLISQTTVREYMSAHSNSSGYNAFPAGILVDVTFLKKDSGFEAISIHATNEKFTLLQRIFQKRVKLDNVFSEDTLRGEIRTALTASDGSVKDLTVSTPIDIQDIRAAVRFTIYPASDTEVSTIEGTVPLNEDFPWGSSTLIQCTRWGNTLTAHKIVILP